MRLTDHERDSLRMQCERAALTGVLEQPKDLAQLIRRLLEENEDLRGDVERLRKKLVQWGDS